MLEVLQFIFSSFWVWLGTMFLLSMVVQGIVKIVFITKN